jgi:hypothetical protein
MWIFWGTFKHVELHAVASLLRLLRLLFGSFSATFTGSKITCHLDLLLRKRSRPPFEKSRE